MHHHAHTHYFSDSCLSPVHLAQDVESGNILTSKLFLSRTQNYGRTHINYLKIVLRFKRFSEWNHFQKQFHEKIILKLQESSRKTSTSALLATPKPLTVWITTNCGKFFKRWEYQTAWPASWEICMQVKKQQLELDVEQQTGKGVQGCILPLCLFNLYAECIMWNAGLDEAQDGVKIAGRNINNFRHVDNTIFMAKKQRRNKESLDESERGEWKRWLKSQHSEN